MSAVDRLLLKWSDGTISEGEMDTLLESYDRGSLEDFRKSTDMLTVKTSEINHQWQQVQEKLSKGSPRQDNRSKTWMIAAVVAILLAAVGYWATQSNITEVINTTQEPMHIAMSDGTEIELAPQSSISYDEDKYSEYRSIGLVGHAFFDVHKKGEFKVATDQGVVSVLGTSFDVWEQGRDLLIVSCYSGRVAVSAQSGDDVVVTAGQAARCSSEGVDLHHIVDSASPEWMRGQLTFDDVDLADIYVQLEAFYDISFDRTLTNSKFSGALPTEDLSKVIEILNAVTEYTYTINGRQVLVALPQ